MLLVKNAEVYAPEYLGKKDVLVCGGKIERIQDRIGELPVECEVLDGEGKILTPGFLDQHVHITGGGGEGSFHTRTPEKEASIRGRRSCSFPSWWSMGSPQWWDCWEPMELREAWTIYTQRPEPSARRASAPIC